MWYPLKGRSGIVYIESLTRKSLLFRKRCCRGIRLVKIVSFYWGIKVLLKPCLNFAYSSPNTGVLLVCVIIATVQKNVSQGLSGTAQDWMR